MKTIGIELEEDLYKEYKLFLEEKGMKQKGHLTLFIRKEVKEYKRIKDESK